MSRIDRICCLLNEKKKIQLRQFHLTESPKFLYRTHLERCVLFMKRTPSWHGVPVCFCTICSSIHDHTDSHCFMKLLQGQLKETLFNWPEGKSKGDMVQKSQRILQENKVAYINGENPGRVPIVFSASLVFRSVCMLTAPRQCPFWAGTVVLNEVLQGWSIFIGRHLGFASRWLQPEVSICFCFISEKNLCGKQMLLWDQALRSKKLTFSHLGSFKWLL